MLSAAFAWEERVAQVDKGQGEQGWGQHDLQW